MSPAGAPAVRTRGAAQRRTRWPRRSRQSSTSCDVHGTTSLPCWPAMGFLFSRRTCIFAELHIQKHYFAEVGVFRSFTQESWGSGAPCPRPATPRRARLGLGAPPWMWGALWWPSAVRGEGCSSWRRAEPYRDGRVSCALSEPKLPGCESISR